MSNLGELIQDGQVPILSFEEDALKRRLNELGVQQGELGKTMQDAMSECSETWHDNAAAEAVRDESHVVSSRAVEIQRVLRNAVVVDHEQLAHKALGAATLGSVVEVSFGGDDETVPTLLTGYYRELGEAFSHVIPNLEAATINSPLGQALLDAHSGDHVSYKVQDRELAVDVRSVDSFDFSTITLEERR